MIQEGCESRRGWAVAKKDLCCHLLFYATDTRTSRRNRVQSKLTPSLTCSLELGPELEVNKDPIPESHPQCWGSKDKHRNDGMHSVSAPLHGMLWSLRLEWVKMKKDGKGEEKEMNSLKFKTIN